MIKSFILIKKPKWELHIYGYGKLANEVKKMAKKNKNIFFHGAVENMTLLKYMQTADLLINPRLTNTSVNDFGFPSKLIEYIMSGTPVLTTNFKSLPNEYKKFLHIIKKETVEGIQLEIEKVFKIDHSILNRMSVKGVYYIKKHNNWNNISYEILKFIETK